ncbi:hypothetical protein HPP92_007190 [Vanilla planifolia]|uniref:Vacuolar protein sorting-associated protein 62 n=1 Tax=Vanilla planifolia TaxID=51239 RepID=A0A835V9E4_VANPL|nr:hypothetical protein HPP92_007190 [Vanilla planifolia]
MDRWKCFWWNRGAAYGVVSNEPEPFSLPSPIPEWPKGEGFAKGSIVLGELEVINITKFESIWSCYQSKDKKKGATFYKPAGIPNGFSCLGHYGQPNDQAFQGFVLAAKASVTSEGVSLPPLQKPVDYTLIWCSANWQEDGHDGFGCFWLPCPSEGYKAVGYVVTKDSNKPSIEEVRCVRADLTETCQSHDTILNIESGDLDFAFTIWMTRPLLRGMWCKGVSVGTFCCSINNSLEDEMDISCLKNFDPSFLSMPNLDQIHALIKHYGPTVFFHPKEIYFPSSVSWFFQNGAVLHKKGDEDGQPIDLDGSNLPAGGYNDGEYWIDLPDDDRSDQLKLGSIHSSELYVHVKPALGGTFTDIVMWVLLLQWSCNTQGWFAEYLSQKDCGGEWVNASNLEYIEGNRAIIYSSKSGHASFPHPGTYLQGSDKLGVGVRNDAARSKFYVDSSVHYQIIAAEYMGDAVAEPCWLQYMREWGPSIEYNSRAELDKIISFLPISLRFTVERVFNKLPVELYGESGPSGPKEKDNWVGDERS